ncbi:Sodium/sulfate symporter [Pluteus cervinus]|uniref:Sodium/sulfate symporter n=1 Tax=Pluteus cervinus TaxID=181527 RepID=A0ACD3AE86_9AGAR|nr:Sodium/sulfate symporter [Pluteus cervinus]
MKFSSSLKFNAVSEWWDEYIAYDALKKCIYQLEKQQHNLSASLTLSSGYHDLESNETEALIGTGSEGQHQSSPTDSVFVPLLDKELKKISLFYEQQEKELASDIQELEEEVELQERMGLEAGERYMDFPDDDDDDDDESVSRSPVARYRRQRRSTIGASEGTAVSPHRLSVSSEDVPDHLGDSTHSAGHVRGSSTIGRVANRLSQMKDSWTSSMHEAGPSGAATIWTAKSDYAYDTRMLFKRKITTLWVGASSLKSYVEVNYSGFRKIMKKYDKVTDSELKDHYLHDIVEQARPFTQTSKALLNTYSSRLLALYTKCITNGDSSVARHQLQLHQREHIAWERDTVWRQMIAAERRGQDGHGPKAVVVVQQDDEEDNFGGTAGGTSRSRQRVKWTLVDIDTGIGRFKVTKKKTWLLVAIAAFILLLNVQVVEGVQANKCFALLVFCTILWATEAIPLFVTSMSVPLLLVLLQVIRDGDGKVVNREDATKFVFSIMFSPTIMLLIGGFTISSALSKTNIDRVIITRVLNFAGTKPSTVLLAFMAVSCFASMWISNVAAPTLCFTLIRPILRTLPPKASFGPCLILAIALAANIGGQSSPISSPQNLIAIGEMDPSLSWLEWFAVAIPVSMVSILLIWVLLLWSYRPSLHPSGEGTIEIKAIKPTKENFTIKQYWVIFVCVVTIGLWCVEKGIEEYVGDMGVVAILPILAFFATGVLKKDDFEQFMWTIVFLAMGGIALGKGVMSSGLLEVLDTLIRHMVDGYSLYTVVLILSPIVLVISTFISHTIASVLLVPIAREVGSNMPEDHRNLLIFITALICSAGMGMPVSGFPNQTAATQEDELGELYLTNVDFLENGVPASIIATTVVSTLGFALMRLIGL